VLVDAADAVLVAHQVYPATTAGNPKARGKMTASLPRARSAWTVKWEARLAYVVRVDNRVNVAHVAATLGVRVKSGRAVHRCRSSACLSRRCVGLCIVVVTVLAAAADAVLVAHQFHPVGNPKA
jgi:hypothetical protein